MAPITRSAARKAFTASILTPSALNIPEILEMILLQIDMRTLLISCQRVCREWRNMITKSLPIQKVLFFTPIKEFEWGTGEKVHNSLLAEMFPTCFPGKGDEDDCKFDFSDCAMTKSSAGLDRFVRKGASWRMMLVQQPPILELGLFHIDSCRGGDDASSIIIPANPKQTANGEEGLRMGRLFEILLFDSTIRHGRFPSKQLCWSADMPFDIQFRHKRHKVLFHRMLGQSGLVLYTMQVIQCMMGYRNTFNGGKAKMDIIEAYKAHGLDVDSQEEEMMAYRISAEEELERSDTDSSFDEDEREDFDE
ncbi:hypothetical protein N7507_010117 [Penicillium longicatenatum]|nr:hypothetical protein N7507_010117 [Penicillium longicatenatum]